MSDAGDARPSSRHGNPASEGERPDESTFWSRPRVLLAIITLAGAVTRLPALSVFPDIVADEGLWTTPTKNFLMFGDWFMDGRMHALLSPVFHGLSLVSFALFGPSIESARLVSALAGIATIPLAYFLVKRLSGRMEMALLTAAVIACSEWAILLSRQALIEATQLTFLLGAATLAAAPRGTRTLVLAGIALGFGLATKLNAAFFLAVVAAFTLLRRDPSGHLRWKHTFVVVATTVVLAGSVYTTLFALEPERFVQAFVYEVDGEHFTASTEALARIGRFGLVPEEAARTVMALFREDPFLFVFATLGMVTGAVGKVREARLFALWIAIGLPFFLFQTFQPIRYLYLVMPAFAYFGALFIFEFGRGVREPARRVRLVLGVVALYIVFNLTYVGFNAVANYGTRLKTVEAWVRDNTTIEERIVAASYFCTNLPNRAYGHYLIGATPDQLFENIRALGIRYVITDSEWTERLRAAVHERYEPIQTWSFATVYRVGAGASPTTPG